MNKVEYGRIKEALICISFLLIYGFVVSRFYMYCNVEWGHIRVTVLFCWHSCVRT